MKTDFLLLSTKEYAQKLGCSLENIKSLHRGKIQVDSHGHLRCKRGRENFYVNVSGLIGNQEIESLDEARRRKITAEANLRELEHPNRIRDIEKAHEDRIKIDIVRVLSILPAVYREARLTEEQAKIIRNGYTQALENLNNFKSENEEAKDGVLSEEKRDQTIQST